MEGMEEEKLEQESELRPEEKFKATLLSSPEGRLLLVGVAVAFMYTPSGWGLRCCFRRLSLNS